MKTDNKKSGLAMLIGIGEKPSGMKGMEDMGDERRGGTRTGTAGGPPRAPVKDSAAPSAQANRAA